MSGAAPAATPPGQLARKALAELVGAALLVAAVVGSGVPAKEVARA